MAEGGGHERGFARIPHFLTLSLSHSLTLSLSHSHSFTLSLFHSLTLSLPHSLTLSLSYSFTLSLGARKRFRPHFPPNPHTPQPCGLNSTPYLLGYPSPHVPPPPPLPPFPRHLHDSTSPPHQLYLESHFFNEPDPTEMRSRRKTLGGEAVQGRRLRSRPLPPSSVHPQPSTLNPQPSTPEPSTQNPGTLTFSTPEP